MVSFNFADRYKAAGFSPTNDTVASREKPFEEIRKGLDSSKIVDLVRLYFQLPAKSADWFREAFAETDKSFTLVSNGREAAVLASCLLSAALEDGHLTAGLAVLTVSVGRNRIPAVAPELLAQFSETLLSRAVSDRRRTIPNKLTIPATSTHINATVDQFLPAPDWPKLGDVIKATGQQVDVAFKAMGTQFQTVLDAVTSEMNELREESEMLWWMVGGWSDLLQQPLTDFAPALRAVLAGIDLGRLARTALGPANVPAILARVGHFNGVTEKVTIQQAVDTFTGDSIQKLKLPEKLARVADICPVHCAVAKAQEIGSSPAWHQSFTSLTGVSPETSFTALELSMQVYRETVLLARV
jgi:hypothetical protein